MTVALAERLFTVADYYRMAEAGILSEDARVELIDGKVVDMSPIGARHAACVNRLTFLFGQHVGQSATVIVQNPVRLDDYAEPVPDLALVRPREDFYADEHPRPADVLLVVEVADTSEDYDRDVKAPMYARAGIPEVWLVCLSEGCIEVYTRPVDDEYQDTRRMRPGEVVAVKSLPEIAIAVEAILG